MTRPSGREHFIPITADDLTQLLVHSEFVDVEQRDRFLELCHLLRCVFHHEYHQQLMTLKSSYAAFDPDADTLRLHWDETATTSADASQSSEFFHQLVGLFEKANFRRLSREQIEEEIGGRSASKLNLVVDYSVFDRLEIFCRGETLTSHEFRSWRNFFRLEKRFIPVHQRLVIAFRLRPDDERVPEEIVDRVVLKIFKEIPRGDLEMLLPGIRIRMTLFDRAKIALPTISGVVMAIYRIVRAGMAMAYVSAYGIFGILGLIAGTIGYGVKSFFGYLRTKDKYQANLTKSLYFQNLDNNAGVLYRLIDEVEEQEFREAILVFALLGRVNSPFGRTVEELDDQAEQLLYSATGIPVDFEADDALKKLIRLNLVEVNEGRYRAHPLTRVLKVLDERWDRVFDLKVTPVQSKRAA